MSDPGANTRTNDAARSTFTTDLPGSEAYVRPQLTADEEALASRKLRRRRRVEHFRDFSTVFWGIAAVVCPIAPMPGLTSGELSGTTGVLLVGCLILFMPAALIAIFGAMNFRGRVTRDDVIDQPAFSGARRTATSRTLEALGDDPLGWPLWTLLDEYRLVNRTARGTAHPYLTEDQVRFLGGRARQGLAGTIGEHVEDLTQPTRKRVPASAQGGAPAASARSVGNLRGRHHDLKGAYGTYLTDPIRVLEQPLLNDVADPFTSEFIEAFEQLESLTAEELTDAGTYSSVLERAWKAWRAASANAEKKGLRGLEEDERRKVRRAQDLLALALDTNGNIHERARAEREARKLLDGIVVLPAPAQLAIEASLRPLAPRTEHAPVALDS